MDYLFVIISVIGVYVFYKKGKKEFHKLSNELNEFLQDDSKTTC